MSESTGMKVSTTRTQNPRICALIPARGGSKGIPYKNICILNGSPLIYYSTSPAKASKVFDDIYVSTEDDNIAKVAEVRCGVKVFQRAPSAATDSATCEAVIDDFVSKHGDDYDIIFMIQPTNPLILPEHFQKGLKMLTEEGYDSVLTVTRRHFFRWSEGKVTHPLNYKPEERPNRQDHDGDMLENGGFYGFWTEVFKRTRCRLGGTKGYVEMPPYSIIELDEKYDLIVMEQLVVKFAYRDRVDYDHIKMVVFDVDGVLTPASVLYDSEGEYLKEYNLRDVKGIKLLIASGIKVCLLSASNEKLIQGIGKKLGIPKDNIITESKNKLFDLLQLCKKNGVTVDQVAYMGDDIIDIDCLKSVGLSSCPSNAHEQALLHSAYVSKFKGGKGAARELCDILMKKNSQSTPRIYASQTNASA